MNIPCVCNRSPTDESLPACVYSRPHATQLTLTALSAVAQQCHSSMTALFCSFFPLVAVKHSAQHATSQPPAKSPGETGDGVFATSSCVSLLCCVRWPVSRL